MVAAGDGRGHHGRAHLRARRCGRGRAAEPGGGAPKNGPSPGGMAWNGPGPQRWSAMNVVVCVKQIPDPAVPGSLESGHQDPRPVRQAHHGRLRRIPGSRWPSSWPPGDGDEVTLVSMAPGGETSGLRTGLAMGAAKAILVSDDALAGSEFVGDGQGAGGGDRPGEPRSRRHGDRIDRRLHRDAARAGGRAHGAAVRDLHEGDLDRGWFGQGRTSRPSRATTTSCARMPAVVTVTAGVVEPRYPSFKGIMAAKSKPVDNLTVADLGLDTSPVGAAAPARSSPTSPRPRRAQRGARGGRGRRRAAVVAFLEQLKVV